MVNPLRGFISENHCLFEELDKEGKGIELYKQTSIRSFIKSVLDTLLGRAIPITIAGDTVNVNVKSAELFFFRNAERFQGILREEMSLQDKILRLLEARNKIDTGWYFAGLPRGLFEEIACGGEEGKRMVIGLVPQFLSLIESLENNGFKLPQLRDMIFQSDQKGYLQFDREDFFMQIIEENKARISQLTQTHDRLEVRKLAKLLIQKIESELDSL